MLMHRLSCVNKWGVVTHYQKGVASEHDDDKDGCDGDGDGDGDGDDDGDGKMSLLIIL